MSSVVMFHLSVFKETHNLAINFASLVMLRYIQNMNVVFEVDFANQFVGTHTHTLIQFCSLIFALYWNYFAL